LLGLLHATLHRSRELGVDLAGALRVRRYTLALGLLETAEGPGGLTAATLDLRSGTLPGGRTLSGLGADRAQQERSRRHYSEPRKVFFHASTPSRFCPVRFVDRLRPTCSLVVVSSREASMLFLLISHLTGPGDDGDDYRCRTHRPTRYS